MIDRPGIYNITDDEYHADPCLAPSLSSSIARVMLDRSPAHAWAQHPRNPECIRRESTDAMDFGTAAHALCLRGINVMDVIDAKDWRTNAAKAARDASRAEGRIPLLPKDESAIRAMKDALDLAISKNSDLSGLTLVDGDTEQTIAWMDGGVWVRARLDWIERKRHDLIIDYKTTSSSANPTSFVKQIIDHGYDIQAGFYTRGCEKLFGHVPKYILAVQETESPYLVSFIGIGGDLLALGNDKAEHAIRAWRECLKTMTFPGYPERTCWVQCPAYAQYKWSDQIGGL